MGLNILTLGSSKTYTNLVALGISSAVVDDTAKTITFTLASDGSQHTIHFNQPSDGQDGVSVTGISDKGNGVFTLLFSDGSETDPIQCVKGEDGFSPTATVEKVGKVATITITDKNGTTTATIKDGEGSEGGEANVIDSISVNGVNVPVDENKNVDITIPSTEGLASETWVNEQGFLTEHQDISGKVDKVDGKSLIADSEITRLASVDNYDDTQVKSQIQAVANGLMDSVGYSADYKTIDIIAKNGVKKSVNVAPIISHASITELSDVDTTNKATGKALVYNATTSKHEYADVSGTDEKVKMDSSTDAKYLGELLDNVTIANENGELKVKKLDGQEVTITEINYLKGLTMNVMDLVNMFSNGGVKIINTPVATYAELLTIDKSVFIDGISYLVYVLADENHDNAKTTYLVDKDSETPTYFGFADSQRDFTTNPIDLATEITGKLGIANMDSDAIKALFTVDDTYKTETATNNAFSTHGAKALYDELLLAIGNKANDSDLTTHKNDTDIHVSTEDRTKWDSAKTHADSAHAPSNAQANVIESVKVNNQEITPDENKAVNIDLTGYAEHDEIVGENLIPYPYKNTSKSINGVEFVDNGDGTVTATGTSTSDAFFYLSLPMTLKAGTYVFSNNGLVDSAKVHMQIYLYETPFTTIKSTTSSVNPFTVESDCEVTIRLNVLSGETVDNYIFKPMLEAGSIVHEYQPYNLSRKALRTDIDNVAELASRVDNQFATASGDYITVNDSVDGKLVELSVKGNSFQQTYSGKNLFNATLETTTLNGVTCTNNGDGTYTLNGTASSDVYFNLGNVNIIPGNKYRLCCTKSDTAMKAYAEKGLSGYEYNTLTATSSIANVTVSIKSGVIISNVRIKPMLTTDLNATYDDFEPYVGGTPSPNPSYPQAINSVGDDGELVVKSCGKNLIPFPYYNGSDTRNGITATVNNDDGSITLNGTATSNYFFVLLHRNANGKGFAKKLRGKTVTISGGTSRPVLSFAVYDEDGNNVTPPNNEMLYDYGGGVTVTIPDNACDMYSYYYFSSGNAVDVTLRPQLEVSDVVTEYESYKESTSTIPLSEPLRAIGDVKDEITYQDGKWGVLRRIGKHVIDGTEGWVLDSDHIVDCGISVRLGGYTNILKGISSVTGNTKDMITDYLRCIEYETLPYYATSNSVQEDKGSGTYRTPGNIWISFGASDIEKMGITKDIDSVSAWLSSHNITFIYPLGTPTFEPFTDQTLPYLSTYDGVTNISNDDALSAEMTVKYPTTDASGVGSQNESRIAELAKDTDDKFDDVNKDLSVIGKCKNLLNPTLQTTTQNGVTCTNNGDGTYTFNGTATGTATFIVQDMVDFVKKHINKDIRLVGCPKNGGVGNKYRLQFWGDPNSPVYDVGNGDNIHFKSIAKDANIAIIIDTGIHANNLVFKPMLTTNLNATYDDFVPYTGDGETLASDVAEIKKDLGGLSFSVTDDTLTITNGTKTWTIVANS